MILKNYRTVSEFEFVNTMNKHVELGDYRAQKIKEWLGNSREFYIVSRKEKERTSVWLRLTLPLWFAFLILSILFLPIQFLFTGRWGYTHKKGIGKLYSKWSRKLGLY